MSLSAKSECSTLSPAWPGTWSVPWGGRDRRALPTSLNEISSNLFLEGRATPSVYLLGNGARSQAGHAMCLLPQEAESGQAALGRHPRRTLSPSTPTPSRAPSAPPCASVSSSDSWAHELPGIVQIQSCARLAGLFRGAQTLPSGPWKGLVGDKIK